MFTFFQEITGKRVIPAHVSAIQGTELRTTCILVYAMIYSSMKILYCNMFTLILRLTMYLVSFFIVQSYAGITKSYPGSTFSILQ